MKRFFQKTSLVFLCFCLLLGFTGCTSNTPSASVSGTPGGTGETSEISIAFLFPGLINDNGWNATAYRALETLEKQGYKTAYTEGVKVDSIEETFRNYAQAGFNVLVGHGFEFGEPALMLASEFPDVNFCITGKMPDNMTEASNVSFVEYKEYEAAYAVGMLAAGISQTGKVGFITGETNPTQLADLAAFTNGARYINPDIQIMGVVTGTFDDPAKGQETAKAQIDAGADVIAQSASQTGIGAMEAASGLGVYVIGNGEGQNEMFPDYMAGNFYTNTYELVTKLIQNVIDGNRGGVWRPGLAEGVEVFEIWKPELLDDEIETKINTRIEEIESGSYVVEEIHERIDQ